MHTRHLHQQTAQHISTRSTSANVCHLLQSLVGFGGASTHSVAYEQHNAAEKRSVCLSYCSITEVVRSRSQGCQVELVSPSVQSSWMGPLDTSTSR
jgi:hypothetical protein